MGWECLAETAVLLALMALVVVLASLFAACSPAQADPMSPDEEYRWLTEDQGLSHDEARKIVDIPNRRR